MKRTIIQLAVIIIGGVTVSTISNWLYKPELLIPGINKMEFVFKIIIWPVLVYTFLLYSALWLYSSIKTRHSIWKARLDSSTKNLHNYKDRLIKLLDDVCYTLDKSDGKPISHEVLTSQKIKDKVLKIDQDFKIMNQEDNNKLKTLFPS